MTTLFLPPTLMPRSRATYSMSFILSVSRQEGLSPTPEYSAERAFRGTQFLILFVNAAAALSGSPPGNNAHGRAALRD